jgi:hypothetical protein
MVVKMDYITQKYADKYKKLLKEEQSKDLISLLLDGYNTSDACEIISIASTFNCNIDVASSLYGG